MVKVREDLTGKRFERLVVLKQANDYIKPNGRHESNWLCQCDCGNIVEVLGYSLKSGHTKSCGCLHEETLKTIAITHGDSYSKLYGVYISIIDRCYNPNNKRFKDYGGRGIIVCDEWKDSYLNFKKWAVFSGYKECLSIDRKNNDLGYSPSNCRWVTRIVQQNNMRKNHIVEYNGQSKTIAEWSRELNIKYDKLWKSIKKGLGIEDILKGN